MHFNRMRTARMHTICAAMATTIRIRFLGWGGPQMTMSLNRWSLDVDSMGKGRHIPKGTVQRRL